MPVLSPADEEDYVLVSIPDVTTLDEEKDIKDDYDIDFGGIPIDDPSNDDDDLVLITPPSSQASEEKEDAEGNEDVEEEEGEEKLVVKPSVTDESQGCCFCRAMRRVYNGRYGFHICHQRARSTRAQDWSKKIYTQSLIFVGLRVNRFKCFVRDGPSSTTLGYDNDTIKGALRCINPTLVTGPN